MKITLGRNCLLIIRKRFAVCNRKSRPIVIEEFDSDQNTNEIQLSAKINVKTINIWYN
jgi:hypothetical protein